MRRTAGATVYTAIEEGWCAEERPGVSRSSCGRISTTLLARGDMAYLDTFATSREWQMSPPRRNPDDVSFDDLDNEPEDDDDLDDEEDEEELEDEDEEDLDDEDFDEDDEEDDLDDEDEDFDDLDDEDEDEEEDDDE